jgi:hypothetical protein
VAVSRQRRHHGRVKPPPACLPAANSRKWHSRRAWDQLGYLRVRSLANPAWERDVPWLLRVLLLQRGAAPDYEASPYDLAVAAVRRYPRTADGRNDEDAAWDQVLTAIDDLLYVRQQRHLERVISAGASGAGKPS